VGRMCPFETPEGPNSGLVKNIALMSQISVGISDRFVEKFLYELGVMSVEEILSKINEGASSPEDFLKWSKVILNGMVIGYHPDGESLVKEIRARRRAGELNSEIRSSHSPPIS